MGLHVSLPDEMENKVLAKVKGGMYSSASEVVREALRRMFKEDEKIEGLSEDEFYGLMFGEAIEEFESGKAEIHDDADEFFNKMEEKYS